jgi:predicted metal-dependent phosphoesterase TrpH
MPQMTDEPPPARFGAADLHMHTSHGDGMVDAPTLLHHIEVATDLDVIAITDHDDIRGALIARETHARGRYPFEFVPGMELTTRSGHLLALWIDQPLPPLRPLAESIAAIHRAGGLAVIPHPMSYLTRSIGHRTLERLLALHDPEITPDGIEVANPSPAGRVTGAKAARLNRERYHLAETGGSDTHFPEEAGTARTLFPGHAATDLRHAIQSKMTRGVIAGRVPLRQIGIGRLAAQQIRGLSTTPRKVVAYQARRLAAWRAGAPGART